MISFCFILRPSSKPERPGSLTLRIIYHRKIKSVTLSGCRLHTWEWNKETQSIIYPVDDTTRSSFLKTVEQKVESEKTLISNYISEFDKRGQYSIDDIIFLYRKKIKNDKLLDYTELLALELEHNGQERTARAYRTTTRSLVAFNKGADIPLCHINSHLIKSFETYLRNIGKMPNTISYYMRNLRAIYNKAIASRHVVNSTGEKPFSGVYTGVDNTRKRALTEDELKSFYSLDFAGMLKSEKSKPRPYKRVKNLVYAWQLFFFSLYARGMCFVDLAYLRKDNIKDGVIKYCRKKTGRQVEVKITTELQNIINSFSGKVKHSDYVFPIIRDNSKNVRVQYENGLRLQNYHLKMLSRLAGIHSISTHVARHTWATIGKRENVPLRVLSECLGHTSEKTTLIYMGSLDNSILDKANDHITSVITRLQSRIGAYLTLSCRNKVFE